MNYRGFFFSSNRVEKSPTISTGEVYSFGISRVPLFWLFCEQTPQSYKSRCHWSSLAGNTLKRFSNCSPQDYFAWKRNFWNIFILVAVLINVRWHWLINALSLSTAIRWLAERHESPVSFPPLIFDTGQHLFSDLSCKSKGLLGRFVYCWHWCLYWPGIKMLKWMGHTP